MKGGDEGHWGCSGYGEWSQILEGPEHRAEKFYVRQGDRMLPRPGTGSAPLRQASFPDEQKPIFHRMLGMEALCSARSLKASLLPRKPGLSRSAHPAISSKNDQCSLGIFSTCSAQHISWSLPCTQDSTHHFSRQKGGWGSGHLLSAAAS